MARRELYFFDANILMYAIGKEHPYKRACIQVLRQIKAEIIPVVGSVEILQEILYRYYSLRNYEVAVIAFANMKKLCEAILPVVEADVDRAYRILRDVPDLGVRDVIHAASMLNNDLGNFLPRSRHDWEDPHAASMLNNDLGNIISADRHFDRITEIRRVDPMEMSDLHSR